ncbi:hypothetical protein AMS68_001923 [Peltaster fructicola]|uniref:Transcription factor domain-containing protein n=1 Tax=Peltaster fructicola TaxID=286661 RepID=A0A6H0XNZ7_9PEZI|nr:hypothetical protein AMS68_001923 [Peltaster fructicola]
MFYASAEMRQAAALPTSPAPATRAISPLPKITTTLAASLQSILPSRDVIASLIDYHKHALLWSHTSIVALTVQRELAAATLKTGELDVSRLHLADVGILLAVLAGSIAHPPAEGFDDQIQQVAGSGRTWYNAAVTCMQLSEPDIRHVRTIQVLSVSSEANDSRDNQLQLLYNVCQPAENAGFTWSLYGDFVNRLVQGPHPRPLKRLVGRSLKHRLWSQLCVQDWLATHALECLQDDLANQAGSALYASCNTTDILESSSLSTPCITPSFLNEVLKVIARSANAVIQDAPYTSVIELDMRLRNLSKHAAYEAHASNRVVLSHMVLLIHRRYFLQGAKDEQYEFSRWASVKACKQLISSMEEGIGSAAFSAWQFMSPLATAAITLCRHLQTVHLHDAESHMLIEYLDRAIAILRSTHYAEIATYADYDQTAVTTEVQQLDTTAQSWSSILQDEVLKLDVM